MQDALRDACAAPLLVSAGANTQQVKEELLRAQGIRRGGLQIEVLGGAADGSLSQESQRDLTESQRGGGNSPNPRSIGTSRR